MLKAKLDSVRKNKKGFSLVELIIVIAIMVALIAVLAPSYIKYVQKSRVSAYENACEEFLSSVKEAYSDPDNTLVASDGTITIAVPDGEKTFKDLCTASSGITTEVLSDLITRAGAGSKKLQKVDSSANKAFVITVKKNSSGNVAITMAKAAD